MLNVIMLIVLFFLLGYLFSYVTTQRVKAQVVEYKTRVSILENSYSRAQLDADRLRQKNAELQMSLTHYTNNKHDVVQLTKERDEAREYAEKYHKLYKDLLSQNDARELVKYFTRRVV